MTTLDLSNLAITKIPNKTTINDKPIQIIEFKHKDGSLIQRKELKLICSQYQKSLQGKYKDGIISVSIEYVNRWFSADSSFLNEEINYFSLDDYEEYEDDPEEYKTFRFIFVEQEPTPEGGKDEHNDCLIKCIKKSLGTHKSKFMIIAEELKEELGLQRDDPIPINLMHKVESYMNHKLNCRNDLNAYSIFVSGDFEYISKKATNKRVHIVLSNGHYSLDTTKYKVIHCKSHEEKPIAMIEFVKDEIHMFDGEKVSVISRQELNDMNDVYNSKYTVVLRDLLDKKTLQGKCIEDAYYLYQEMADELKQHLGGRYNFYKCGNFKEMALHAFFENTKATQPEKIPLIEASWINDAASGALMHWEPYQGTVHEYDINSLYPHIMQKNNHYFPIKEGKFETLTHLPIELFDSSLVGVSNSQLEYGIYRCIITKQDSKPYKLFRFNKRNKYTHLDISVALHYGLKVQMICDGQPNALIYTKDKLMNGAYLFKTYIDELYALKKNKVKGAKQIMNVLWGALSESTHYYHNVGQDEECKVDDAKISRITVDDKIRIQCIYKKKKQFKTNWGRIKPFVLAYARSRMYFVFKKFEPLIIRMHTDSLVLEQKNEELKTGPELGNLKYEGMFKVNITGMNKTNKVKMA